MFQPCYLIELSLVPGAIVNQLCTHVYDKIAVCCTPISSFVPGASRARGPTRRGVHQHLPTAKLSNRVNGRPRARSDNTQDELTRPCSTWADAASALHACSTVFLYAFDLIELNWRRSSTRPLERRKARLEMILASGPWHPVQ
jgi:hypothetical protein